MKEKIKNQTITKFNSNITRVFDLFQSVSTENVWLANYTSKHSRENAQRAVSSFIAFSGIETPQELYKVSQSHIMAWREFMISQGLSSATVANRLSLVSSLYKFLTDKQLVKSNPVAGVRRPKSTVNGVGAGKTPRISKDKASTMMKAPDTSTLQGVRDRAILAVFFMTGCRVSEPTKLKVKDLRPDGDYWALEYTAKGGKKNVIAINPQLQIVLMRYLKKAGHENDRNGLLFRAVKNGQNTGGAISRIQFYRLFKKYALMVGLPAETSPHWARSTFISEAFDAGVEPNVIRATAGHSSLTTTETYNHSVIRPENSASFAVNYKI
jgi:site-specific recombinase XerD